MNKYYKNAIFCPDCRKIWGDREILFECEGGIDGDAEHKASYYEAFQVPETERGVSEGEFHYYFRRPPLRMFSGKADTAICSVCKLRSSKMVCPECKRELTTSARVTEAISVVGIKGCGKTVYIGALIRELKRFFSAREIGIKVEGAGGDYNLQPGKALPGGTPVNMLNPVQLHIGRKEDEKYPLDLLIYDIAGEALLRADSLAMEMFHHLSMSSLIIYLFDPLTASYHSNDPAGWGGRSEIKEHYERCRTDLEAAHIRGNDDIVSAIIEQIQLHYKNDLHISDFKSKAFPISIAASISSSDFLCWKPGVDEENYNADEDTENQYYECYRVIDYTAPASCLTPQTLELLCETGEGRSAQKAAARKASIARWEKKGLLQRDNLRNSDETVVRQLIEWMQKDSDEAIRRRLQKWGEGNSLVQLKDNFKEIGYFGFSSLNGRPEQKGGDFICPNPCSSRNVANPVLWYLKRAGYLEKICK